ncbi:unnamed protein product [Triticum turgidum subsp. durum]|uniref:Neprosin PEP catalytic domain-containing protein n=1 Tax=Triticum turgidum subsp. durum TaxID=4567 RepID=A0A9R1QYF8_TRITD|nr:unnamed protein product [Triticum turgidum subsp. durum]
MQRETNKEILAHRNVNKTIMMEGGDVYDCIDVSVQPTLDHPLLKYHKIQMEPSSVPVEESIKPPSPNGVLQAHLSIVECPKGMVPILRNNRMGHIASYITEQVINKDEQLEDPKTANWWLMYGEEKTPIGYWPSSLFSHIKDKGIFSYWGGFVQGPTASSDSAQMGSGHFASEGYGKAAFMRNIQIVDINNKLVTPNRHKDLLGTSDKTKYSIGGYVVDNHGMHMYYGGPGNLF